MRTGSTAVGALFAGLVLAGAARAEDFVITGAETSTNGGNAVDGGDSLLVTATGSVTTTFFATDALSASGDANSLTNLGTLSTSATSADGMRAFGSDNSLTNGGTVTIGGNEAYGLFASGGSNALANTGSVTTAGSGSHALLAVGASALTNDGAVTTSGQAASGLFALGAGSTLTNAGTVTTGGNLAHGLRVQGDDNTLFNDGAVSTTGNGADGLLAFGTGNALTNSGTVLARGENSHSVAMFGPDATLRLLAGSVLEGDVLFDTPGSATLSFGPGLNAVVGLETEAFGAGVPATLLAPGPVVAVGDAVHAADLGEFAAQDAALSALARLALDAPPDGAVMARGPGGLDWARGSALTLRQPGDDDRGGWSAAMTVASAGTRPTAGLAVFGGLAALRTEADSGTEAEALGLHLGVQGRLAGFGRPNYAVAFGVVSGEVTREQADTSVAGGLDRASDRLTSLWLSPSLAWRGLLPGNGDLRLRYALLRHGALDFDHEGPADVEVDARTAHEIEARLAWSRALGAGRLQGGLDAGYRTGGALDLALSGAEAEADAPSDGAYGRVFLGFEARGGSLEIAYDSDDRLTLGASYAWRF